MTQETFINLKNGTTVSGALKKLDSKNPLAKTISGVTDSAVDFIQYIAGSNLLINILTSVSLNRLWGMLHCFEIVAHYYLFGIDFPTNATIMYFTLYDIANFSLLPD